MWAARAQRSLRGRPTEGISSSAVTECDLFLGLIARVLAGRAHTGQKLRAAAHDQRTAGEVRVVRSALRASSGKTCTWGFEIEEALRSATLSAYASRGRAPATSPSSCVELPHIVTERRGCCTRRPRQVAVPRSRGPTPCDRAAVYRHLEVCVSCRSAPSPRRKKSIIAGRRAAAPVSTPFTSVGAAASPIRGSWAHVDDVVKLRAQLAFRLDRVRPVDAGALACRRSARRPVGPLIRRSIAWPSRRA